MTQRLSFTMTALFTLTLAVTSLAQATVPYPQIEQLRRQTIVVRVAMDKPQSKEVKACKVKLDFGTLGAKLSLAQDGFSKPWEKLNLKAEDMANLDMKTQNCVARASCQTYSTFVAAAKADASIQAEMGLLKETLDKKAAAMTAADYLSAWKTVPNACLVLKQVLKN